METRPAPVTTSAVLAAAGAVMAVIWAGVVVSHAGQTANDFIRHHPNSSRAVGLAGSYILAALTVALAVAVLFATRAFLRRQRWGWTLLLVLSVIGVFGSFSVRSVAAVFGVIVNLATLVLLLLRPSRRYVDHEEVSEGVL